MELERIVEMTQVRFGMGRPSRVPHPPTDLASLPALSIRPVKADQAPDERLRDLPVPQNLHAMLLGPAQKQTRVKHKDDNCFGWHVSLESEHRLPAPFYFLPFTGPVMAAHGNYLRLADCREPEIAERRLA
jgi:hypothetical protein